MPRTQLPVPAEDLQALSRRLLARIRQEIDRCDFLPFSRFMELALYEPGLGYYSAGLPKLGADGDFVTSPELGDLFATCLSRQVAEVATELGAYEVLELGAGTGRMAFDLLTALPVSAWPARYSILETSADLRAVQQQRLEALPAALLQRICWLDSPPGTAWRGVLLANEVIDALPVERFRVSGDGIEQMGVGWDGERLVWQFRMADEHFASLVGALGLTASSGYCSEILPTLPAWIAAVTGHLAQGLALFIDYGYPRREYYLPERRDGTLMCHYRHRAHGDPFFWPGLQDITASVDFTALAEAGDDCGLQLAGYVPQAMFLLGCGLDAIVAERLEAADDHGLKLSSEARQLTLPTLMGERFQVMGLQRGLEVDLRGFSLADHRHRL